MQSILRHPQEKAVRQELMFLSKVELIDLIQSVATLDEIESKMPKIHGEKLLKELNEIVVK
jgi:hypothetical protein